ncbi:PEP-CTERM sorting domain-containing protein [Aquabacterium humicola]|uniref:PEP-CTERM sorting domain-containing protein n=1 Tax=Aquabacterium humicola TaxID=3237377 RepID=UPI002542E5CD|nr:PEP-CTERM sorting domain-containing protein [Rubrivivax pictus]
MYLYPQGRPRSPCPACGGEIRRLPRSETDRAGAYAGALRRYGCVADGCTWQGLLPRQPRRAAASRALVTGAGVAVPPRVRQLVRGGWPLLLATGALALVSAGPPSAPALGPVASAPLLPGEYHDGLEIAAAHPLLKADTPAVPGVQRLALRQGCAWGLPGRNPYRGTVEEALVTAKLPAEVIQRIAYKVKAGAIDDRLIIGNAGIRAQRDQREFEPGNVAMTYGKTLCVNTRVNFKPGHVEQASLYEAADKRGRLYAVMVPDVCGNVSVLGARMERKRRAEVLALPVHGAQPGGAEQVAMVPVLADIDHAAPPLLHQMVAANPTPARHVPEPSTLACVLGALGAAALFRRRGRTSR